MYVCRPACILRFYAYGKNEISDHLFSLDPDQSKLTPEMINDINNFVYNKLLKLGENYIIPRIFPFLKNYEPFDDVFFTLDYLLKNIERFGKRRDWGVMTLIFHISIIEQNSHLPWDYKWIWHNPTLTYEFLMAHLSKETILKKLNSFCKFSSLVNDSRFLDNFPVNYSSISMNSYLTQETFVSKIDEKWNMEYISKQDFVTADLVLEFPFLNWNWRALSDIVELSLFFFEPEKEWEYYTLGIRYQLYTKEVFNEEYLANPYILKTGTKTKDADAVYMEEISDVETLEANLPILSWPNVMWKRQPFINIDFDEKYSSLITEECGKVVLSIGIVNREKVATIKKYFAAQKIKKWWIEIFWNVATKVGQKRLLRSLEKEEYSVW